MQPSIIQNQHHHHHRIQTSNNYTNGEYGWINKYLQGIFSFLLLTPVPSLYPSSLAPSAANWRLRPRNFLKGDISDSLISFILRFIGEERRRRCAVDYFVAVKRVIWLKEKSMIAESIAESDTQLGRPRQWHDIDRSRVTVTTSEDIWRFPGGSCDCKPADTKNFKSKHRHRSSHQL